MENTKNKKSSKLGVIGWLISLYKPHRKTFILAMICTCIFNVSTTIYPVLSKKVMNKIIYMPLGEAIPELVWIAVGLLSLLVTELICNYVTVNKQYVMHDKIESNLYTEVYAHIQKLSFAYFDNHKVGKLLNIMSNLNEIPETLSEVTLNSIGLIVSLISIAVVFANLNITLLIMGLPVILIALIISCFLGIRQKNAKVIAKRVAHERSAFTEDKLSGIRTVISFGNERKEITRLNKLNQNREVAAKARWKALYLQRAVENIGEDLYYMIILIAGPIITILGKADLSDTVVFYMYSYMITNALKDAIKMIATFSDTLANVELIMEVLAEEPEIQNSKDTIKPEINGEIEFNNVSFGYTEDKMVLNNFNLHIDKGEYVALVGQSGIGKSTIAGLVPRFYEANEGSILIDGINIKDIELNHLHKNVGLVQQEIYLFNGSVYDNISYGVEGANMEQVIEAAKLANADEFISKLENGYNTDIGEKGVKLSGGQKQRLAIARLFLVNPPILIFDEATSALDTKSEKLVQKALERLAKDRTTIVIAHRLSTIKNADRILLITENGIEEQGTHSKLIKFNGKYAELYKAANEE